MLNFISLSHLVTVKSVIMSAEEKLLGNFKYNIMYIILLLDSHFGILRVNNHIMQYYRTTVLCTNVISTCAVPFSSYRATSGACRDSVSWSKKL